MPLEKIESLKLSPEGMVIEERRAAAEVVFSDEIRAWNNLAEEYDKRVYSITSFPEKRERIVASALPGEHILIAGGGSEVYLQRDLLSTLQDISIIVSDFSPEMLRVSAKNFNDARLDHRLLDTRALGIEGTMDRIIVTNSIVPETRDDVIKMYSSLFDALKQGGEFVGYFPSFTMIEELAASQPEILAENRENIDFENKRYKDTVGWQSWQTEATLREELSRAGFKPNTIMIERVPCESDLEANTLAALYDLPLELIKAAFSCFFVKAMKG